ncbi:hypothetical protein FCV25MIE_28212 [Fagus crenata]
MTTFRYREYLTGKSSLPSHVSGAMKMRAETIFHLLWTCPYAKQAEVECFMIIQWLLWTARNDRRVHDKEVDLGVQEFSEANASSTTSPSTKRELKYYYESTRYPWPVCCSPLRSMPSTIGVNPWKLMLWQSWRRHAYVGKKAFVRLVLKAIVDQ